MTIDDADRDRWIPIAEREPARSGRYLVWVGGFEPRIELARWTHALVIEGQLACHGAWIGLGFKMGKQVTHWRELPEPPTDPATNPPETPAT